MKNVLVLIDLQNDFFDLKVLGNQDTKNVLPKVVTKLKEYGKNYTHIFCTRDIHFDNYLETLEGQRLPIVHCLKDTRGANIHHDIYECLKELKSQKKTVKIIDKHTFGSKELVDYLSCLCGKGDRIEFCGVLSDVCVISNVLAARMELPNTQIVVDYDCCAGSTPDHNNATMWILESCQIDVISNELDEETEVENDKDR